MLCQNCGKKEATTYVKQIINGQVREAHLCPDCAAKLGASFQTPLQSMFSDPFGHHTLGGWAKDWLGGTQPFTQAIGAGRRCPTCGMTESEVMRTGRAGCADCYSCFEDLFLPYIRKLQGTTAHVGQAPAPAGDSAQPARSPVEDLKAKLQQAIAQENYEEAARLRDEIRRLEGQR